LGSLSNVKVKSSTRIIFLLVVFRFKHLDKSGPKTDANCLIQTTRLVSFDCDRTQARIVIAHSSMRVSLAVLLFVATPALADERLLSRIGCGDEASFYAPYALPIADAALEGGALRILVVGSSSTAGTGAGAKDSAYPARTRTDLNDARIAVVARGKGGETAKGALARMMSEIDQYRPDLVVWQVGTNDLIRSIFRKVSATRAILR